MPRLFTVQEANDLVPNLTTALTDLIAKRGRVQELRRDLAVLEVKARSNGRESAQLRNDARQSLESLLSEMNEAIDQINALGCELKDLERGLVDFRSMRDGRQVYLCWKLGEDRVGFWHELESGFTGRQPL